MNHLLLILAFSLFCSASWAEAVPERSLMFTREEEDLLRSVLKGSKVFTTDKLEKEEEDVVEAVKPRQVNISLSALIYTGPNDWVAWINGARITPGLKTADFSVSTVTDRYVELIPSWQDIKIRLAPRQTYHAAKGAVIEGIVK